MINSGDNFLNGLLGNGSAVSGLKYYQPFERTNDLADTRSLKVGKKFRQLEDYITPAKAALDRLVIQALNELSDEMSEVKGVPNATDIVKTINDWLNPPAAAAPVAPARAAAAAAAAAPVVPTPVGFKTYLQTGGYTAKLVTAAKRLNTGLDNVDRHILSRDGLFFYTAYRAIVGFKTEDVDGIISSMVASLDVIKMEINRRLVGLVIDDQNLANNADLKSALEKKFSKRSMPYDPGTVIPLIVHEYRLQEQQSGLYGIVGDFLKTNNVNIPAGVDRSQFMAKMVDYLADIGYEPEPDPLAGLDQKINERIDQKIAPIQNQADTLETNVGALTTEVESLRTDLTNLETKVDEYHTGVVIEANSTDDIAMLRILASNDFSFINGIGPKSKQKLLQGGIYTFSMLAEKPVAEIDKLLTQKTAGYNTQDFIDQARAIVAGDHKRLKDIQDKLPRKPETDIEG